MQRKVKQDTQWATKTEVVTASESDTDEEERVRPGHVRRAQQQLVVGGETITKVVGTELIAQDPLVEEYMSEEIENQVRRKPKRRATRQVVREVEESSEEEVIVRKRSPKKRATRVVETVRKSPKRRVEYIQESSSEEEVIQTRRPVVKQRVIPQPAKVQKIVVEEPQQKITKAIKETIKIPIQTTKTESYQEEEMLQTEADRALIRELETKLKVRTIDLSGKEIEIQQLANMLEAKKKEFERCQLEITQCSKSLQIELAKPKSHIVSKTREVPHTEYKEKKVRKVTTETPVAVENWQEIAAQSFQQQLSEHDARSSYSTTVVRRSSKKSSPERILPGAAYTTVTRDSNVFASGSPTRISTTKSQKWNKY